MNLRPPGYEYPDTRLRRRKPSPLTHTVPSQQVHTYRRGFATAFGGNLVLNAGWSWLFFTARRPRWALAEIVLLEASNLDLTRRAAKVDSRAAAMFVPYAGWVAFATALTAAIAHRNPEGDHPRLA